MLGNRTLKCDDKLLQRIARIFCLLERLTYQIGKEVASDVNPSSNVISN